MFTIIILSVAAIALVVNTARAMLTLHREQMADRAALAPYRARAGH